eukprot:4075381-Amphidinium_carterae.1
MEQHQGDEQTQAKETVIIHKRCKGFGCVPPLTGPTKSHPRSVKECQMGKTTNVMTSDPVDHIGVHVPSDAVYSIGSSSSKKRTCEGSQRHL